MDTIQANGRIYRITTEQDLDNAAPWDNDEGCGIVSDRTSRDKRAGELLLCSDRSSKRFYDFAGTVAKAKLDHWGVSNSLGMTCAQIAEAAARADFERLRAWCNNEWQYVGVIATDITDDPNAPEDYSFAVWGIESDDAGGIAEIAQDLIDQQKPNALRAAYITAQSEGIAGEYIYLQVRTPDARTNWLRITPEQAAAVFALLCK